MSLIVGADQDRFDELRRDWYAESPQGDWEGAFTGLVEEWREVEWRSGGRTLLTALGLQFNEVALCRGLAWLLDPEGGHGLGHHALHALLRRLDPDVPVVEGDHVAIRVEESQADSRADIVVRVGERTVVIEAKVHAGEQPGQADRYFQHWAGDELTKHVFLTRTGHLPYTAEESEGDWVPLRWSELARLLRTCADGPSLKPSAGAHEFIETIGAL